jgi:hypothetical protein
VQDLLRHQRGPGIVEVQDVLAPRRLTPGSLHVKSHRLPLVYDIPPTQQPLSSHPFSTYGYGGQPLGMLESRPAIA